MATPTKDKYLLLLPVTEGGVTQYFNMPNVAGYNNNKATHNGIDFGWCKRPYIDIIACQDGTVVDVFYNSSVGNAVVLQHDYDDGTHRWTGYIHLKEASPLQKGAKVTRGQKVGVRGGSPYVNGKAKYGVHLHLYVTECTKKAYSWANMKSCLTINPFGLLYRGKNIKYETINSTLELPYYEDAVIHVTDPSEKDVMKNQILEHSSNLRVRMKPSLNGTIIGYLKPNAYYDYFDVVKADGYDWYQIANEQWCAKTSTMEVFPGKTELDILREQNALLQAENESLKSKIDRIDLIIHE